MFCDELLPALEFSQLVFRLAHFFYNIRICVRQLVTVGFGKQILVCEQFIAGTALLLVGFPCFHIVLGIDADPVRVNVEHVEDTERQNAEDVPAQHREFKLEQFELVAAHHVPGHLRRLDGSDPGILCDYERHEEKPVIADRTQEDRRCGSRIQYDHQEHG